MSGHPRIFLPSPDTIDQFIRSFLRGRIVLFMTVLDPIVDCDACGNDAELATAPGPGEPTDEYDCCDCGHQFRRHADAIQMQVVDARRDSVNVPIVIGRPVDEDGAPLYYTAPARVRWDRISYIEVSE